MTERKQLVLRHIALQAQYDSWPIGPLRRIVAWYFREFPGSAALRDHIHHAQTVEEMRALVDTFGCEVKI